MRIREIIFQGIFDSDSAVRLATAPGVDRMSLPAGLSLEDVQAIIISFLYPSRLSEDFRAQFEANAGLKLALVFEHEDKTYRILRREASSSLRLQIQRDGAFKKLTKGEHDTLKMLDEEIGLPDFETFVALNLWRFDDDAIFESTEGHQTNQQRELIEKYRVAVRVEALEDRIKSLRAHRDEQRGALGKGAKIDEKLEQARAKLESLQIAELSEDELELLAQKEERIEQYEQQLDRLERQEDEERVDVERKLPERPWSAPAFWGGLVAGLAALGVSVAFHDSLRQVAAVNVVGFGVVAWALLKYFTDLERASVHQVRLESIKRRLNQVREEMVSFREKLNHLLIHAGVQDEAQLYERVEKSEKLQEIIEKLEKKSASMRRDSAYKAARADLKELDDEIAELQAERTELPDYVMSTFQLESDLKSLDLDPQEVLAEEEKEVEAVPDSVFGRLQLAAKRTDQWQSGDLDVRTIKMWAKICGHVLGDRFKGVTLSKDGELGVRNLSEDQLQMWQRTRGSEERIVAAALALALHVNSRKRSKNHLETIWVTDPRDDFGSQVADAFDDVFGSAAKKSHIVLCTH